MSIWGETTPAVMRIGAAAHGFFVATLLPSGKTQIDPNFVLDWHVA